MTVLSVVVPCYNEQEVLPEFHRRLSAVFEKLTCEKEIVYVNDGSTDGTLGVINELKSNDPRVGIVDLSRNFGKEIAMAAGFDYACGDAIVVIDADLQDPPELIPEMIQQWQGGYDVVMVQESECRGLLPSNSTTEPCPDSSGHRRLSPDEQTRRGCAESIARTASLHEGTIRLDRVFAEGIAL
jgi:glycosyltransferase involved in cell wall biosynthesis